MKQGINKLENTGGFLDKNIKSIHRVYHVLGNEVDWSENICPLQLTFADNSVLLLKGGSDGESLIIGTSQWEDPLEGELDPELQEIVQTHGKRSLVDVSMIHPYASVVGQAILAAYEIRAANDNLCGMQLSFGEVYLNFIVVWDECHVLWGKDNPEFETMRVTVTNVEIW